MGLSICETVASGPPRGRGVVAPIPEALAPTRSIAGVTIATDGARGPVAGVSSPRPCLLSSRRNRPSQTICRMAGPWRRVTPWRSTRMSRAPRVQSLFWRPGPESPKNALAAPWRASEITIETPQLKRTCPQTYESLSIGNELIAICTPRPPEGDGVASRSGSVSTPSGESYFPLPHAPATISPYARRSWRWRPFRPCVGRRSKANASS